MRHRQGNLSVLLCALGKRHQKLAPGNTKLESQLKENKKQLYTSCCHLTRVKIPGITLQLFLSSEFCTSSTKVSSFFVMTSWCLANYHYLFGFLSVAFCRNLFRILSEFQVLSPISYVHFEL